MYQQPIHSMPSMMFFILCALVVLVATLAHSKKRSGGMAVLCVMLAIACVIVAVHMITRYQSSPTRRPTPIEPVRTAGTHKHILANEQKTGISITDTSETQPAESADRPDWVDAPPKLVDDVYRMSVSVGPFTTREECEANLPGELQKAVYEYAATCLGNETAGVALPLENLRSQLVKADWEETRQYSVGPMVHYHVLLEFDRKVKQSVLEAFRQAAVNRRLQIAALLTTIAIATVATLFGYLKIDLATGGAYRSRLRIAATGVILGLVFVAIKGLGIGD